MRQKNFSRKNTKPRDLQRIDNLTINDLKKIINFLNNYNQRRKEYRIKYNKIKLTNEKNKNEYDRWINEFDKIADRDREEINEIQSELNKFEVGFLGRITNKILVLHELIERNGKYYKVTDIFRELAYKYDKSYDKHQQNEDKKKKTSDRYESVLKPLPKFYSPDPNIIISGIKKRIDPDKWTLAQVETELDRKINNKKNNKDEIKVHRKQRSSQEIKKRKQAYKLRDFNAQQKILSSCPYCGGALNRSNSHQDHIYPISKGGQSAIENLVIVCARCNTKKGISTLRQFIKKNRLNETEVHKRLEILKKDF